MCVDLLPSAGELGLVLTQPWAPLGLDSDTLSPSSKELPLSGQHRLPALLGRGPSRASASAKVTARRP